MFSYSDALSFNGNNYSEAELEDEYAPEEEMSETVFTLDTSTTSSSKAEIYQYRKEVYDQVTNNGNDYDPEVHDPMVAQMAAE
jgi:hypothetical protein